MKEIKLTIEQRALARCDKRVKEIFEEEGVKTSFIFIERKTGTPLISTMNMCPHGMLKLAGIITKEANKLIKCQESKTSKK